MLPVRQMSPTYFSSNSIAMQCRFVLAVARIATARDSDSVCSDATVPAAKVAHSNARRVCSAGSLGSSATAALVKCPRH